MAPYISEHSILSTIYEWQTLITGILAVGAAALTMWATLRSARMQCEAMQRAAQQEIEATNAATERQIEQARIGAAMQVAVVRDQLEAEKQKAFEARIAQQRDVLRKEKAAGETLRRGMRPMKEHFDRWLQQNAGCAGSFAAWHNIFDLIGRPEFDAIKRQLSILETAAQDRFAELDQYLDSLIKDPRSMLAASEATARVTKANQFVTDLFNEAERTINQANWGLAALQAAHPER